jgi:hypothetical protein
MEKQQNYRSIEQILNEGILQAVRNLVPVKSILKDFMNQDVTDTTPEEDSDDDKEDKEQEEQEEPKDPKNEIVIPSAISLSDIPIPPTTPSITSITSSIVEPIMAMMKSKQEEPKEIKETSNPTIVLTDKHNVSFGKYNTVFSTEHPEESDMVIDIRDDESIDGNHVPALEIMEGAGQPLADDIDFDTLDGPVESMGAGDYEEL